MEEIVLIIILAIIAWIFISNYLKKKRRKALFEKYGDRQLVEKIIKRMFWQGQTTEQLKDSLGSPVDIDTKILKNTKKEIWKYDQTGKSRFALRITIENGAVVGWDKKS